MCIACFKITTFRIPLIEIIVLVQLLNITALGQYLKYLKSRIKIIYQAITVYYEDFLFVEALYRV